MAIGVLGLPMSATPLRRHPNDGTTENSLNEEAGSPLSQTPAVTLGKLIKRLIIKFVPVMPVSQPRAPP
uniref:Secreted protein n=1 Tax=Panagrellus redivivus TaxID=6233 RepID=A0A7E4WEB4_PANRE